MPNPAILALSSVLHSISSLFAGALHSPYRSRAIDENRCTNWLYTLIDEERLGDLPNEKAYMQQTG